ncbi:MAG: YdcF family protein, partial [Verrucomicrobiota bacterium]
AAFLLATLAWILVDGLVDRGGSGDIGVILGGKVFPSGTPSRSLRVRIEHGLRLYQEGRVQQLLVSGGLGKEGHDEAVVMRDYLIRKGVPASDIIVDSNGLNTRRTATFTATELQRQNANSVIVVSQYFHITRSKLACRQAGIRVVRGSAPKAFQWRDCISVSRELIGIWAYVLRFR